MSSNNILFWEKHYVTKNIIMILYLIFILHGTRFVIKTRLIFIHAEDKEQPKLQPIVRVNKEFFPFNWLLPLILSDTFARLIDFITNF